MSSTRIARSLAVERLDGSSALTSKNQQLQTVEPTLLPAFPSFNSIIDDFWLLLQPIVFPSTKKSPRQKMRGKVTVVVLDIKNILDKESQTYWQLTAVQKIHLLAQHIDDIATRYKKKYPKRMLIFTWREYGICKSKSRFIDVKIKNILKETMQGLTQKHPSIVIIAGTVAIVKPCTDISPELIKDAVRTYKKLEKKYPHDKHYAKKYRKLFGELADASQKFKVKNSCYIFSPNGVVDRMDKELPYDELYDQIAGKYLSANTFFQPGKIATRNKVKEMTHTYTGEKFYIGFEICIEHYAGLLRKKLKKLPQYEIDLQLVASASIYHQQRNIVAGDFVHADSDRGVSHLKNNPGQERVKIDVVSSPVQMR